MSGARRHTGAFEKEHKNVLADIRNTIAKCSESFNALNFELVEYTDTKGEKRPNDAVNTHCKKSINSATVNRRVGRGSLEPLPIGIPRL